MVLEILSLNPLLVVESEQDFYGLVSDLFELLLRNFNSSKEPSERWHYALKTLELPLPLSSNHSLIAPCLELNSLDAAVVETLAYQL